MLFCRLVGRSVGVALIQKLRNAKGPFPSTTKSLKAELRSRSRPEPAFLAGAGAEKITKFRLRLLVNCKAENYEFKTTLKNLFSSLIQKVVPKVENVNSV